MPTEICERQLSFVAYVGCRIRIGVACFGASRTLANWDARLARLPMDLHV
jgi:hypothetical protein